MDKEQDIVELRSSLGTHSGAEALLHKVRTGIGEGYRGVSPGCGGGHVWCWGGPPDDGRRWMRPVERRPTFTRR